MILPSTDTDDGKTLLKTYALLGRLAVLFPWLKLSKERQKEWEDLTEAEKEKERRLFDVIAPFFDEDKILEEPRDAMLPSDNPYWSIYVQFRDLFAHGLIHPGVDGAVDIIDYGAVRKNQLARQKGQRAKNYGVFHISPTQLERLITDVEDYLKGGNDVNGAEGIWWVALWEKVKYDCYPDSYRDST